MGLDMHLFQMKKQGKKTFNQVLRSKGVALDSIGYWRKANHIHYWFVKNIQNGNDNCEYYNVSKEKLEELLDTCNKVLNSVEYKDGFIKAGKQYSADGVVDLIERAKIIVDTTTARELLPRANGFFFGSEEYDEFYVEDIKETIQIIESVLKNIDFDNYYIVYMSSW
jgi:hypothetical protein